MLFGAVCYAATGWLTGAVVVLGFNFIVRRTGGIEASVLTNDSHALPAMRSDPQLLLRCARRQDTVSKSRARLELRVSVRSGATKKMSHPVCCPPSLNCRTLSTLRCTPGRGLSGCIRIDLHGHRNKTGEILE